MVPANSIVIVSRERELPPVLCDIEIRERIRLHTCDLWVLAVQPSASIDARLAEIGYIRLFENFCFESWTNGLDREAILGEFFSFLAKEYDCHIKAPRNIQCYNYLFEFAKELALVERPHVLDYGCGTGSILASCIPSQAASIVGFDIANEVEAIAAAKGLRVWSEEEFLKCTSTPLDLIVASYVFHYGVSRERLDQLINHLSDDGILVANHHKGFNSGLTKAGLREVGNNRCQITWRASPFGLCVGVKKISNPAFLTK